MYNCNRFSVAARLFSALAVFGAGLTSVSIVATADEVPAQSQIIAERTSSDCGSILSAAGQLRTFAKDAIAHSVFTKLDDMDLRPFSYGTIYQIRDAGPNGRVIYSTSTGHVALFGGSVWGDTPFGVNSTVLGLRAGIESSKRATRFIAFTWDSAAVVNQANTTIPLVKGQHGILDANFILHNRAAVILPKSIRIYRIPKVEVEAAVLETDISAKSQFWAGAVDPFRGRIVALDGQDLVVITVSGDPEEVGDRKVIAQLPADSAPVDKIVLSQGTRFYVRQGQKLTFYDTEGNTHGTLDVGGPLQSMDWDHSDKLFAFSTTTGATGVYNLETRQVTMIGKPGEPWRRVAWSKNDGLLLTLGPVSAGSAEAWAVDVWDPATGQSVGEVARYPLKSEKEPYPYLVGLRGSLAHGNFQFYVVRPNGQFSNVAQSFDTNVGRPKSTVIAIPTVDEERRLLN